MSTKSPTDYRVAKVELESKIDAPPQRVWDAMVNQTTRWWRTDFYTNPRTKAFQIEPRPGGRMYEDWGDGNGLVWANVVAVDAPRSILFHGLLTPEYGGPAQTIFRFTIEPAGGGSIVKISDTIYGNISVELAGTMHEGWTLLFDQGLKPFVESK